MLLVTARKTIFTHNYSALFSLNGFVLLSQTEKLYEISSKTYKENATNGKPSFILILIQNIIFPGYLKYLNLFFFLNVAA